MNEIESIDRVLFFGINRDGELLRRLDEMMNYFELSDQTPPERVESIITSIRTSFEPYRNFAKYMRLLKPIPSNKQEVHEAYQKYVAEVIELLNRWLGETK